MRQKAIIFDFDGTMIDSEVPLYEVWREIFKEHDLNLTLESWVNYIGAANDSFDPFGDLQKQIKIKLSREEYQTRAMTTYFEHCDRQNLLPGVERVMEFTKTSGLKLGLASSSEHQWLNRHLNRLRLKERFHCIRGREDVVMAKPAPDLFLSAAEGLGVDPKDCIVIEDSRNGLFAAKEAGMFCIVVPSTLTKNLDLRAADLNLKSLADLKFEDLSL